jgi:radical SAM-linked protein
MQSLKIRFCKLGAAKYISHLDLQRAFQRAIKRSCLPIWHTEGFNPHIYLNFACPLPLGVEGENELLEIKIAENLDFGLIKQALNHSLSKFIRVSEVSNLDIKFEKLLQAQYRFEFVSAGKSAILKNILETKLASEEIVIEKTLKEHGQKIRKSINVLPQIKNIFFNCENSDNLIFKCCLPCGNNGSVNPLLLCDALMKDLGFFVNAYIFREGLLL